MKYPLVIPTSKDKVYNQFLRIINFLIYEVKEDSTTSRSPLTNKELDVLSLFLFYNDKYRNLPPKERAEYIMSTDVRKRIRQQLSINVNHLNNVIGRLKAKYYLGNPILDNGVVCPGLAMFLDDDVIIEFTLNYEQPSNQVNQATSTEVPTTTKQSGRTPLDSRALDKTLDLGD
jgi:hypothetical protein